APDVTNGMIAPWVVNAADNAFVTYDSSTDAAGTIGLRNATITSTDLGSSTLGDLVSVGDTTLTADADAYALIATGSISGPHTVTIHSGGFIADGLLNGPTHSANFRFGAA